jgi:hypothetical protein
MKIKPDLETQYEYYKSINSDPYGGGVVKFAERWADLMEKQIPEESTVPQTMGILVRDEFAKNTSHEADTEGITGFMYGCAVSSLAKFWVHGEALRRWHNKDTQLGTEGDQANENGGVLNPAVINIA